MVDIASTTIELLFEGNFSITSATTKITVVANADIVVRDKATLRLCGGRFIVFVFMSICSMNSFIFSMISWVEIIFDSL